LTLKTTLSIDAVSGHVLFLSLTHALCGDAAVNIAPEKTRGYLVAPPADFVVDGLFAEWQSPREDMDEEAVGNENVDITHYDAATLDETFFYLRVDGDILAGVDVPSSRTMMLPSDTGGGGGGEPGEPGTTTQEETPLPVQTGEDAVFIFLDTRDEQLGYFIDGVFYDKLVEVKGQNGEISSSKLLEFVGSEPDEWNWHPVENIHAASGGSQIEGSSSVDPASVLFHVVSWGGERDESDEEITLSSQKNGLTRAGEDQLRQDYEDQRHYFVENEGQLENTEIFYYYNVVGRGIGFGTSSVFFRLERENAAEGYMLKLEFPGANTVEPVGMDRLEHYSNYFLGRDPEKWRSGVPHFREIRFIDLYPGIDLCYFFTPEKGLKYEFIVKPGSDPTQIRLNYGNAGMVSIESSGSLMVAASENEHLVEERPYIYQQEDKTEVAGAFRLAGGNEVTYDIPDYDKSQALVIDPALDYSTFLGGSSTDIGKSIAVDTNGNAYIAGRTASSNFPTTSGCYDSSNGGIYDVFFTKLTPSGGGSSDLLYSTYLGGNDYDYGEGVAVDSSGNVYITGYTESSDFPTTSGCYDSSLGGTYDAFFTKLTPSGGGSSDLLYSTYLGGSSYDYGYGIAVDSSGNAYITGSTGSSGFPTTSGCYDNSLGGTSDAFFTKLTPSGGGSSDLLYSTFLGGSSSEVGRSIAVDSSGNAYITGRTYSSGFPTTSGCYDSSLGGTIDVFFTKLTPSGGGSNDLLYSTYLGGSGNEDSHGIAVDSSGNAYITGETTSGFPTTSGCYDSSFGGTYDAFFSKLSPSGGGSSDLLYSTFLGGSEMDKGYGIAVDSSGNAYITGYTESSSFPTTSGCHDSVKGGGGRNGGGTDDDAFFTKLTPSGDGTGDLLYSTYLGHSGDEMGYGIAVDSSGNAYITGDTDSSSFPTTSGCYDSSLSSTDAFFTRFLFPEMPDHDDGGWWTSGVQQNDATTNAVDIKNSGSNRLMCQTDDDYIYFQFYTESSPVASSYTYLVLLDGTGDGTVDYCIASYGETDSVSLYKWDGGWDNTDVLIRDVEDFNFDTTNNVVQFAMARCDIGDPTMSQVKIKAVTYDVEADALEESQSYEGTNNPSPSASDGDYTGPAAIPEFGGWEWWWGYALCSPSW